MPLDIPTGFSNASQSDLVPWIAEFHLVVGIMFVATSLHHWSKTGAKPISQEVELLEKMISESVVCMFLRQFFGVYHASYAPFRGRSVLPHRGAPAKNRSKSHDLVLELYQQRSRHDAMWNVSKNSRAEHWVRTRLLVFALDLWLEKVWLIPNVHRRQVFDLTNEVATHCHSTIGRWWAPLWRLKIGCGIMQIG